MPLFILQVYNYLQIQTLPGEEKQYKSIDEGDQDELSNCGADKSITLKVNEKILLQGANVDTFVQ